MTAPLRFLRGGGGCFGCHHDYPEALWLPVIGPSAYLCWRHVAAALEQHPEGYETTAEALATALGLGARSGPNSPVRRTLRRLERFDIVRAAGVDVYVVLRRLPPLPDRHLTRLSSDLRERHRSLLRELHAAARDREPMVGSQGGSQVA